jgi:3-dehydroquinate synthetase
MGALPRVTVSAKRVMRALQRDKKTRNRVVHFVLPCEIGKVEVVSHVPEAVVLEAIKQLQVLSR